MARCAEWISLILIVSAGVALRLYWATTITPEQVSDARGYASAALELASGQGYHAQGLPTAYYPVGYAATLSLFHRLFGPELAVARMANVCLAALTLISLYFVARALTRSRVAGAVGLAMFAFYPADIAYTSLTLSQSAFNAFALTGVALSVSVLPAQVGSVIAGGALFGWATLTRNQGAVLPILVAVLWWIDPARKQKRAAVLLVAAFLCALVPWTFRNAYHLHAFVPVSTNGGINLYIGNNARARGRYYYNKKLEAPLVAGLSGPRRGGVNEVLVDRRAASLAWTWASQHPRDALALVVPKLKMLFVGDGAALGYWSKRVPQPSQSELLARVRDWNEKYYLILTGLSILGVIRQIWMHLFRRAPGCVQLYMPLAVVALFASLHVLTFGDPCYHHPMMPWIAISAGYGLAWCEDLFRSVATAS